MLTVVAGNESRTSDLSSRFSFALKPKCSQCLTKTPQLALPFQYYQRGLHVALCVLGCMIELSY